MGKVPTWKHPSGPCNSFYCLGHSKNVYDDDDDEDGLTVLPIANLMADSELGSPVFYSSFLVTMCLSRLILEIFACDGQTGRQTDNVDHYYSWPPHCGGPVYAQTDFSSDQRS